MNELAQTSAFEEAACLYVQYLPVVKEMERAFHQALDKFQLDVRQAINESSAPLQVDDEDQKSWRVWWLHKRKNAPEEVPYVWFSHRAPEIILPGQLEFTVNVAPEARSLRPEVEKALRQIELELPPCCVATKKAAEGGIATYVISYGKSANAVRDVAETLTLILKTIERVKLK